MDATGISTPGKRRRRQAGVTTALLPLLSLFSGAGAAAPQASERPLERQGPMMYPEEAQRPPGYGLRIGVLVSDNIRRAPDDGASEEEVVGVGELLADWQRLGPRLDASFTGSVGYRHYTEGTFDDEARANLLATLNLTLLPGNLDWYVSDRLANAPIDPLATASPANIQFFNVLETGPRLTLRPGEANELSFAAARARIDAEESPIDHDRETASARFRRDLGLTSSVSLVASASELTFDAEAEATDFEQQEAYVDFNSRTDTVYVSTAAGMSRTELLNGPERETGIGWFRIGAQRTSDSRVFFGVQRRTGDTAAMLDNEVLRRDNLSSVAVVGDPYISDSAALRYTRGWHAHEWSLTLVGQELDYLVSPLDQEQRGVELATALMLSSRLLIEVAATGRDVEYLDIVRSDDLREFRIEADYRIDANWSLIGGLRHLRRDSTDPTHQFRENFLTLFLSYAPGGREPLGEEFGGRT